MTASGGETRTIDRRAFVKMAGAGGATLALSGPLALARPADASTAIRLKVGVMIPTGSSYGHMGLSLLDGLKLGFDDARQTIPLQTTVVTQTVDRGYGGAAATAERLLDRGTDVVVAGISGLVAERLGPLFAERKASLVVANVGAHVVTPNRGNDYVLHNSLLYWQASYAAGQWAAAHAGKLGFIASSLVDSGYDAIYAFRRGFESAGGTVVGDAVTHVHPGNSGLSDLFSEVRASGANVLYGLYSGRQAAEFVQGYSRSGVRAKLVAGSLGVEDYLLSTIGVASVGATSCASWTRTRATAANQSFTRMFRSRLHRPPDPFAALGYDTAALVSRGAVLSRKRDLATRELVLALAGVSISGPRGQLTVDRATNTVRGPLWMRQVKRTGGRLANVDVAGALAVGSFPHELSALGQGTVAGYINEYLCA